MKHYEKVFYYIAGHRRGWVFSSSDLIYKFARKEADTSLKYLVKKGKIRRINRGLYDYPKYSDLLNQNLSPDIDQVARAYARKFNWRIEISGESALNILGISTQVPGRYVYLSDGPNRSYDVLGTTLEFRKSALKGIGFKNKESSLLIQGLQSLGKAHITQEIIKKLRLQIDPKLYNKILKDAKVTKIWIYEIIKEVCHEEEL
ncbi:MAG: DUF6088 family protein [Candidatus Stygibacter frigidus]|nr:DUF6088 family protein [Candidatus Stygibacter frigidus]